MRRQEVPASQGAFGQKSSFVAKLLCALGLSAWPPQGQAGAVRAQGTLSAQLPAQAVGSDQPGTLARSSTPGQASLATQREILM